MIMNYVKEPMSIEKKSFEIISKELGEREFEEKYSLIVKRVIHTTADFEYADLLRFSPNAVEGAIKTFKQGCGIYTDTQMIKSGVNKKVLEKLNCNIYNFVSDEDVAKAAKQKNITRSMIAMEKAVTMDNIKIFLIGNAPTALYTLLEKIKEKKIKPALIIGVPVGFVGAAEAKEELMRTDLPYIAVKGRKGGSTVAASILNALMYMIYR